MRNGTIGAISLSLVAAVPTNRIAAAWLTWWLGDATGILVLTPFVLTWSRFRAPELREQRWPGMLAALLLLLLYSEFCFNAWFGSALSKVSVTVFGGELDLKALLAHAFLLLPIQLVALPQRLRTAIYERMGNILSGREASPKYLKIKESDRRAILEILRDTVADLPEGIRLGRDPAS